jgi:hypothetical protein
MLPDCYIPTVKHPPKVMVFGAISSTAKGKLVFVEGNVNALNYQAILKKAKITNFIQQHSHKSPQFMEDGAPGHTAKSTQKWHQDHGIQVLPNWPGYSPDLNPIKNVWLSMKAALSKETQRRFLRSNMLFLASGVN